MAIEQSRTRNKKSSNNRKIIHFPSLTNNSFRELIQLILLSYTRSYPR